jgi:hypothetical protein
MYQPSFGRSTALAAALGMLCSPVLAQDQPVQMIIDRGLTDDLPYTAIYPNVLRSIDDGSSETILTLQHPDALLRCDFFSVPGASGEWSAESALSSLDVAGIEATWTPNFPGFKLGNQSIARFASGAALFYEGKADSSPMGPPVDIIHAEAVDNGRAYAVECLVDRSVATDARPMIDFIIANFSTKSDGQCCIDPTDDRG